MIYLEDVTPKPPYSTGGFGLLISLNVTSILFIKNDIIARSSNNVINYICTIAVVPTNNPYIFCYTYISLTIWILNDHGSFLDPTYSRKNRQKESKRKAACTGAAFPNHLGGT